jgi:hypothetical protein
MGFTTVIRAVLALAAALLLGGTMLATAPTASAKAEPATTSKAAAERATNTERLVTCNWRQRRCFGAISFNTRTGEVGFANDKRTRTKAISVAQRSCKNRSEAGDGFPGQCQKAGWVRNGCLALAIRINGGELVEWRSAYAYSEAGAKRKARERVAGPGEVSIHYWLCTTRRR